MPAPLATAANLGPYFPSLSRIRKRGPFPHGVAGWTFHAATKDDDLLAQKGIVSEQLPATSQRVAAYAGSERRDTPCRLGQMLGYTSNAMSPANDGVLCNGDDAGEHRGILSEEEDLSVSPRPVQAKPVDRSRRASSGYP